MANLISWDTLESVDLLKPLRFVHPSIYDGLEKFRAVDGMSPVTWFEHYFRIKGAVQLCKRNDSEEISNELRYVKEFVPTCLIRALQFSWRQFEGLESDYYDELELAEIPFIGSDDFTSLNSTFLPKPSMIAIANRLELQDEFGFIKEVEGLCNESSDKWDFLEQFDVGISSNDVTFWLRLLSQAQEQQAPKIHVVQEIYSTLQRYTDADDIQAIR
jgi:hypothetical protein